MRLPLFLLVFAFVALLGAFLHLILVKRDRSAKRIVEIVLLYWFAIAIGAGGMFAFAGHTFRASQVAASIGWPAGNPFQQEVAFADLALGVLGLAWPRNPREFLDGNGNRNCRDVLG